LASRRLCSEGKTLQIIYASYRKTTDKIKTLFILMVVVIHGICGITVKSEGLSSVLFAHRRATGSQYGSCFALSGKKKNCFAYFIRMARVSVVKKVQGTRVMEYDHSHQEIIRIIPDRKGCLSCGSMAIKGQQRYCSAACRERLQFKLDLRTGLVQALNARYATFFFSDNHIFMDVLPHGSQGTFRFRYPRTLGKTPAEDFSTMANLLGNIWWSEKEKSNKTYRASHQVFQWGQQSHESLASVRPAARYTPKVNREHLSLLQIDQTALISSNLKQMVKDAYRRAAKKNHPDMGGNAEIFRCVHKAYEELFSWARNPTYTRQRGFPDKWFYEHDKNHWKPPLPRSRFSL